MLTSLAALTLVLGMLGGLLWWVRRLNGRGQGDGRYIHVMETVALGPGKCLHLVRLGDRGLLISSTAQRCELICEVEALAVESPVSGLSWVEVFRARLGKSA